MARHIPRYTLDGVANADASVYPFATEDGLGLQLTRLHRADCADVVLLIHGLTSGSDLFLMPEHKNLATVLLDSGFTDVWTLDFRMSNRFPYDNESHRYTLDDIANFDFPAALRELREHIGDRRLHVVAHCLGSVSFSMSLFGGAVDDITSLVCNSVSLTPRIPRWARVKLGLSQPVLEYFLGFPALDPYFGEAPPFTRGWMLSRVVSLFHHECDVRACHMQSFMWGSGKPAMYRHENLLPVTHERMADLCGASGMHYFRHVNKMAKACHVVRFDPNDRRLTRLPADYMTNLDKITTPILFLAGDHNRVFTDSNVFCHELLSKAVPDLHELAILPGYGHLDPIVGKNAHKDVFPKIVAFLKKHSVHSGAAKN